ncbi:UNVERIFIED_CONTAM: hypothetical protein PYX00_011385 [Menopon gallinae]|uniref:Deoxyhypusine hydroxylase n=1 Tax=Menopon gallinae TaxID=328185 RepID=A0AAW2H7N0_9NEOP
MRALFTLRNIHTDESASIIASAFTSRSVLLKHELAYVLGQMTRKCSVQDLLSVLKNEDEDEIVRHEAAEALGNYRDKEHIEVLELFLGHQSAPLRETCALAIQKILDDPRQDVSAFMSKDPAYPAQTTLEDACESFTDSSCSLYKRYEAMFFLRDLMTDSAVNTLVKGFNDSSVLFKHEVAFVLGQMRIAVAVPHLIRVLQDSSEHAMVRHECAEALGAIGTKEARDALVPFLESSIDVIRESAEVALDIHMHGARDEGEYCFV